MKTDAHLIPLSDVDGLMKIVSATPLNSMPPAALQHTATRPPSGLHQASSNHSLAMQPSGGLNPSLEHRTSWGWLCNRGKHFQDQVRLAPVETTKNPDVKWSDSVKASKTDSCLECQQLVPTARTSIMHMQPFPKLKLGNLPCVALPSWGHGPKGKIGEGKG